MKRFLLLFAIAIPLIVSSQNYPLVKNGAIWREAGYRLISPPSTFEFFRHQYFMYGDTIIDSHLYKKVFSTDYDSLIYNPIYIGAMRESSEGKVFVRYDSQYGSSMLPLIITDSSEILLYDFSLSPNDTFLVHGLGYDSLRIVDYIDSVLVGGNWRKRIHFVQNSVSTRVWIEGIGSMKGLFFPHSFEFEHGITLVCYQDSSVYWTHPNLTSSCLTVGLDEHGHLADSDRIELFPNPANSVLYIKTANPGNQIDRIIVRDMLGRVIQFATDYNIKQAQIDISYLKPGTYIAEFRLSNGSIVSKKFIKHSR